MEQKNPGIKTYKLGTIILSKNKNKLKVLTFAQKSANRPTLWREINSCRKIKKSFDISKIFFSWTVFEMN